MYTCTFVATTYPVKRRGLGTKQVGDAAVDEAHHHVHGRYGPWVGKVIEDDLVLQVERDVERIPVVLQ